MFVQGVRDLQSADECECRDVLTGDLGELALEVADARFEAVALPHLNGEKVVVVLLSFSARCVLREERFGHLLEVMERMWRKEVEPM